MRPRALGIAPNGQHIYAYRNVRTNQVLYSLDRVLKQSDLKQLPDIGANHTPPKLRRDIWRPLYSVSLPATPQGRAQGLHAFRKLREWRRLHETSWEPSSLLSRSYTEKEIKLMADGLSSRGGSKKETVYHLMKRKKWKMRVKTVMDQKANSIADLAAVLLEQEDFGAKTLERRQEDASKARQRELEQMVQLATDAQNRGVKKLQSQVRRKEDTLASGTEGHKKKLRKDIHEAKRKIEKMEFALAAVTQAKRWSQLSDSRRSREIEYWQSVVAQDDESARIQELQKALNEESRNEEAEFIEQELARLQDNIERRSLIADLQMQGLEWAQLVVSARASGYEAILQDSIADDAPAKDQASSELDYTSFLPPFPASFDPTNKIGKAVPKRGWVKQEIKRRNAPIFTTEGVKIRWANILDAEFAESWPEDVQHERMGFVRHTHPAPPRPKSKEPHEAVDEISVFKALQWKRRNENWALEPHASEKVEAIRKKFGLLQISQSLDNGDQDASQHRSEVLARIQGDLLVQVNEQLNSKRRGARVEEAKITADTGSATPLPETRAEATLTQSVV